MAWRPKSESSPFFSVESSSPRPPPTWDLIFSRPALFALSVPKPPSSCLVWEWQGSQVKLTPVSLSSLKQAQVLAQLSQCLFVRLSVKPGCYPSLSPWGRDPFGEGTFWWHGHYKFNQKQTAPAKQCPCGTLVYQNTWQLHMTNY